MQNIVILCINISNHKCFLDRAEIICNVGLNSLFFNTSCTHRVYLISNLENKLESKLSFSCKM